MLQVGVHEEVCVACVCVRVCVSVCVATCAGSAVEGSLVHECLYVYVCLYVCVSASWCMWGGEPQATSLCECLETCLYVVYVGRCVPPVCAGALTGV